MKKYSARRVYDHLLVAHKISTTRESLYLVVLDRDGLPVASYKVMQGSEYTLDVGRVEGILVRIAQEHPFALAHTHSSGSIEPSRADREWTRDFRRRVGKARFVDHLVITREGYSSL